MVVQIFEKKAYALSNYKPHKLICKILTLRLNAQAESYLQFSSTTDSKSRYFVIASIERASDTIEVRLKSMCLIMLARSDRS